MRLLFKIIIGLSALFIACCSAFFSVRGLGLLFVGSATMVMVMAASLEVGKLVAASFLYQYWSRIGIAVRLYLMLAVAVLMGITSLGIYGYLARAYERTNSDVAMLQSQVDATQKEIEDTQQRIDLSRTDLGHSTDAQQQDVDKLRQQVAQANQTLDQSLARVDEQRKAATAKRDATLDKLRQQEAQERQSAGPELARLEDRRKAIHSQHDQQVQDLHTRAADAAKLLATSLASEDAAIAADNDRIAVLDRAVDAYTKEGGPGFFKDDDIKKGQVLRDQQQPQRDAIAADIAEHHQAQDKLRQAYQTTLKDIDGQTAAAALAATKDLAAVDDAGKSLHQRNADAVTALDKQIADAGTQYTHDAGALDDQDKALRKSDSDAVDAAQRQIAALQARTQTVSADGSTQIAALYQRINTDREEVHNLSEQIEHTDIGSYRFVARAFGVPVDEVVKWLALVIVVVFDPLAVALTIGFNVAMTSDGRRGPDAPSGATPLGGGYAARSDVRASGGGGGDAPRRRGSRWPAAVAVATALVLATALIGGGAYLVAHVMHEHALTAHSSLVPDDSFAVAAFSPSVLHRASSPVIPANSSTSGTPSAKSQLPSQISSGLLSAPLAAAIADLLDNGFDRNADVYAFLKYPSTRAQGITDRPVMICGLVARVTDPVAAEAGLSRCAETLTRALRPVTVGTAPLSRDRVMVRMGNARYLDPEGGFFTFGLTDHAAVLMLEIEGDPRQPLVEQEMRACLAQAEAGHTPSATQAPAQHHLLPSGGAIALWFDAARCFADMPKSAAAQARYQQLERYLDFDLALVVQPTGTDELHFVGQYTYNSERFRDGAAPPVLELLSKLGPSDTAGLPGRLMDRCADTLDFDSLIERLRLALSDTRGDNGRADVVVEKNESSVRDARFVLTARYDPQAGPPLMAALHSLSLF